MDEHLAQQLSGMYRLYDPERFVRDEKVLLWRGVYGPGSEPSLAGFVQQLPQLAPVLTEFVKLMRFHVAPLRSDARIRKRIEAALAHHLASQSPPVGSFQEEDIRYGSVAIFV